MYEASLEYCFGNRSTDASATTVSAGSALTEHDQRKGIRSEMIAFNWNVLEWPGMNTAFLVSFIAPNILTFAVIPYGAVVQLAHQPHGAKPWWVRCTHLE